MENKSQVAGILTIISGALGVLGMGCMLILIRMMRIFLETDPTMPREVFRIMTAFYLGIGVVGLLIGVLGIIGGVFAIMKKYWGLALAGAIAGIFTFFPCGVAAVVMVSMSQEEFRRPSIATPSGQ